uniref:Uncharacterized protein n=1 Tax=Klebsiella pneumoniae TaxID=573 RepID=A0A6H1Q484_KLEPN|nr:hypothetical protein [Klebsiella pneumoniae]QIZ21752.1 hypothetical protein [Klebsiella pneumoniae]QOY57820.1 hypothetical protein [Salmonella sp. S13]
MNTRAVIMKYIKNVIRSCEAETVSSSCKMPYFLCREE